MIILFFNIYKNEKSSGSGAGQQNQGLSQRGVQKLTH